jgi:molecular chaperone DnaK
VRWLKGTSIPPAPRGTPQIEVSFDVDTNGILSVSAKDKASGKSQSVRIEASTSLSKEEIERLKAEAAAQAAADHKKRELVEARNGADQIVYLAEKSLRDAGDKVPEDVKRAVEEKVAALKAVRDGDDAERIKSATAELSAEIQKIGRAMYGAQGKPQDGSQGSEQQDGSDAQSDSDTPENNSPTDSNN